MGREIASQGTDRTAGISERLKREKRERVRSGSKQAETAGDLVAEEASRYMK